MASALKRKQSVANPKTPRKTEEDLDEPSPETARTHHILPADNYSINQLLEYESSQENREDVDEESEKTEEVKDEPQESFNRFREIRVRYSEKKKKNDLP